MVCLYWTNDDILTNDVVLNILQHVVDQETWIFNLTEANLQGSAKQPNWFREYKFTEEYGLKDLSPAGLSIWLDKMADEPEMLRKVSDSIRYCNECFD